MPRPIRIRTRTKRTGLSPRLRALLGGGKPKRKLKTEEHDAQVALFDDYLDTRLVAGAVAFAIGNGGKRHKKVAIAMKKEGVKRGIPDVEIIHASRVYFIEMKKARGGRLSTEQRVMIARLSAAGAICAVCNGLQEAVAQLEAWGLLTETGDIREEEKAA